jgi:large subunit GTPase 1
MPAPKSKSAVGLGNSLMNDRFGKGKGTDRKKGGAVTRTHKDTGEEVHFEFRNLSYLFSF